MSSSNYEFEGLQKKAIDRACYVSIKAHHSGKLYVVDKKVYEYIVIAFAGSWSLKDWYAGNEPFGETKVDLEMFTSLRSIGNNEAATVNQAFLDRFLKIKNDAGKTSFCSDVEKAVKDKKKIIFAGHYSGGPIAIFAAIWFFEKCIRLKPKGVQPPPPFCLTFGSPLTADRIFCHAVRREKWSDHFINFVSRFDIVPRILLSPLSSIEDGLQQVLSHFKSNSPIGDDTAKNFFMKVMENASCAASHAACTLTVGTDDLLSTLLNFSDVSPYRPFGTYIFRSESGKLLAVKNPDAVLQLLFYSSQLSSEAECPDIASKSLKCHLAYQTELQGSIPLFDKFQEIPIFLDNGASDETKAIDAVLNDLGLGERGRLSLHAAIVSEKQKRENQVKFEKLIPKKEKEDSIEGLMETLKSYRKTSCETRGIGYYDSFRKSESEDDFEANIARLKLAAIWDEIIEMLKRYELPDPFEGEEKWVDLGTEFRRLVEPLDIANFYRHGKYEDAGPYMTGKGRGRRYRYTQRWLEHFHKLQKDSCGESCFWAELEQNLVDADKNNNRSINVTPTVKKIEGDLKKWYHDKDKLITKDAFFQNSTLVKWWNRLPETHGEESEVSWIKEIINSCKIEEEKKKKSAQSGVTASS